jgi:hypothetical protein
MTKTFTCACCRRRLPVNPRIKNQRYCGDMVCQRERKRHWQQVKMATDPDYRANQQDAYRIWRGKNLGYWRRRRGKEDENIPPNKHVTPDDVGCKMDASTRFSPVISGNYLLVPLCRGRRKMDALKVNIHRISAS